jgi:hypothetical protein
VPESPRRPGSGPPAESGGRESRHRVLNGARRGSGRGHPRAATRGAGGQNLHRERWGDLLPGYSLESFRRGESGRSRPRRSPGWRQILLPRPHPRRHVRQNGDLLRDTRPPRRTADRRLGSGPALRRRTRCPHRGRARDPRRPPGGPVGGAPSARGDAGAAAVRRGPAPQLRPLLDAGPRRRPFGRYPRSRRCLRNLYGREPGVASAFKIAVADSSSPLVPPLGPVFVARREAKTFSGRRSCEHAAFRWAGFGLLFPVTFSGMGRVQVDGRIFFGTAYTVAFGEAK